MYKRESVLHDFRRAQEEQGQDDNEHHATPKRKAIWRKLTKIMPGKTSGLGHASDPDGNLRTNADDRTKVLKYHCGKVLDKQK